MITSAGKAPREIASQTALVYRRKDGRVVHQHEHITLEGATIASVDYIGQRALEHAVRRGYPREKIAVLHVNGDALKEGAHYKVNIKSKKLVELPKPKHQRPQRRAGRRTRAAK
jgi:hypothetical protein